MQVIVVTSKLADMSWTDWESSVPYYTMFHVASIIIDARSTRSMTTCISINCLFGISLSRVLV